MFPAYPGFEDLPLRVKVQWQGRKRPVVARLERWPETNKAVLVCALDNDEGEWIVRMGQAFYFMGAPSRLLCRFVGYDVKTRASHNLRKFSDWGKAKLSRIVRRAFAENNANFGLVRVLCLPKLPNFPRIVAHSTENLFWCSTSQWQSFVPFRLEPAPIALDSNSDKAGQQLQNAWEDQNSDAYFAWQWAALNREERLKKCTGFEGDWDELKEVMELILRASSALWDLDSGWNWWFNVGNDGNDISSRNDYEVEGELILKPWQPILDARFRPKWREKWLTRHLCVAKFWREEGVSEDVYIDAVTAHEQLEAKLQLRAWLQDKAMPAQIKQLLSI